MNNDKRYIPGTRPEWNRTLPEGYDNEIVDSHGNNYDNGYNFEEADTEKERAVNKARGEEVLKNAKV